MIDTTTPTRLPGALESIERRTALGTALRSDQLERLPLDLRQRAFFSARVENARFLEIARVRLEKVAANYGRDRDRASFVADMQQVAIEMGLQESVLPEDRGTLRDITSRRRLELIYNIQTGLARGEANWRMSQDVDLLNAAPAQELIRLEDRRVPREWNERWQEAGGQFYGSTRRMIARKDDPIWSRISRFGLPWPPFDFNSGMGLRNVRRREATALGLIAQGERLAPTALEQYDADVTASMSGLSENSQVLLEDSFGDLVSSKAETLTLEQTAVSDFVDRAVSDPRETTALDLGIISPGRKVRLESSDVRSMNQEHGLDLSIWDDLPATLWQPDEIDEADLRLPTPDGETRTSTYLSHVAQYEWRAQVAWIEDAGELVGRVVDFVKGLRRF